MHDFMAELICVGCGPGDPDLLTVKAVKAIKNADVIMCPTSKEGKPSFALSVVSSLLDQQKKPEIVHLVFPMTKDTDILKNTWKKNSEIIAESTLSNKKVVYLTVGDPYLYSTWIYLNRELSIKHPEIKITVIPGIVSMFTFASKVGISLAEGAEKMAVIPSCYDLSKVKEIAKNCDTMIFLKDGRYFDQVIDLIRESGFSKESIFAIGQDLGTDHEIIRKLTLGEVTPDTLTTKYFSIMVIKRV
jgi:precorrin-2/cobalt-factor-2 C20-methyltransferase